MSYINCPALELVLWRTVGHLQAVNSGFNTFSNGALKSVLVLKTARWSATELNRRHVYRCISANTLLCKTRYTWDALREYVIPGERHHSHSSKWQFSPGSLWCEIHFPYGMHKFFNQLTGLLNVWWQNSKPFTSIYMERWNQRGLKRIVHLKMKILSLITLM